MKDTTVTRGPFRAPKTEIETLSHKICNAIGIEDVPDDCSPFLLTAVESVIKSKKILSVDTDREEIISNTSGLIKYDSFKRMIISEAFALQKKAQRRRREGTSLCTYGYGNTFFQPLIERTKRII